MPRKNIRYVDADVLAAIEKHEKQTGLAFNQGITTKGRRELKKTGIRLPVMMAMVHNDVEIRCVCSTGAGLVLVDMTFEQYETLPSMDVNVP